MKSLGWIVGGVIWTGVVVLFLTWWRIDIPWSVAKPGGRAVSSAEGKLFLSNIGLFSVAMYATSIMAFIQGEVGRQAR